MKRFGLDISTKWVRTLLSCYCQLMNKL